MSTPKQGHGIPREQYLNDELPETYTVVADEFDGEIITINASDFDPKRHKRCNAMGQLTDEKGRVFKNQMPDSQTAADAAPAKK